MDALPAAPLVALIILVLVGLAATLGVDSRDGFADDRHHHPGRSARRWSDGSNR